jgi:transcriptional regulator with XRE-family HTH domain
MPGNENFGRRLKELRLAAGLDQKGLAGQIGVSIRAVSHWEQGLREPGWSNVVALGKALGVDCRAFLVEAKMEGEDPKRGRPRKHSPKIDPGRPAD